MQNMPPTEPTHEVYIDSNDFLHVTYHGRLNETNGMETYGRIEVCAQKLAQEKRKIRLLADVRDLGKHDPAVRHIGLKIRETIPFVKMAIIVAKNDPYTRKISEVVTQRSSRKKYIKYFDDEARAITWLRRRRWRP